MKVVRDWTAAWTPVSDWLTQCHSGTGTKTVLSHYYPIWGSWQALEVKASWGGYEAFLILKGTVHNMLNLWSNFAPKHPSCPSGCPNCGLKCPLMDWWLVWLVCCNMPSGQESCPSSMALAQRLIQYCWGVTTWLQIYLYHFTITLNIHDTKFNV